MMLSHKAQNNAGLLEKQIRYETGCAYLSTEPWLVFEVSTAVQVKVGYMAQYSEGRVGTEVEAVERKKMVKVQRCMFYNPFQDARALRE